MRSFYADLAENKERWRLLNDIKDFLNVHTKKPNSAGHEGVWQKVKDAYGPILSMISKHMKTKRGASEMFDIERCRLQDSTESGTVSLTSFDSTLNSEDSKKASKCKKIIHLKL